MSEIRIDPLSGLRVIVVPGDALAPLEVGPVGPTDSADPILTADAGLPSDRGEDPLFAVLPARGAHERIGGDRPPGASLADLSVSQLQEELEQWRDRMRAHDAAAYVHVCAEERPATAAPLLVELFALDFVPSAIARERERFSAHAVRTMGANLLEDVVAEEVRRRERIVAIDDEAVLWCPYASGHAFQMMLAPRRGRERFQDDGPTGAAMLHRALTLLRERCSASPPLSLWIRSAPRGAERFCWRIDIVPRLAPAGGLQLGTGVHVNPVAPERAAAELRALV